VADQHLSPAQIGAPADSLTICMTIASRLVILRYCSTSTASRRRPAATSIRWRGAGLEADANGSRRPQPAANLPCSTDLIPCSP